jgi:hypothetical protein
LSTTGNASPRDEVPLYAPQSDREAASGCDCPAEWSGCGAGGKICATRWRDFLQMSVVPGVPSRRRTITDAMARRACAELVVIEPACTLQVATRDAWWLLWCAGSARLETIHGPVALWAGEVACLPPAWATTVVASQQTRCLGLRLNVACSSLPALLGPDCRTRGATTRGRLMSVAQLNCCAGALMAQAQQRAGG